MGFLGSRKSYLVPGFSSKLTEIWHSGSLPQPAHRDYFFSLNFDILRPGGPFKGKKTPKMAIFFQFKEKIGDSFLVWVEIQKKKKPRCAGYIKVSSDEVSVNLDETPETR